MLIWKKRFVSGAFLFVLLSFSSIIFVGASSMWSQTYGGTAYDCAYTLVGTSDGGFALAGETNSFGAGESDFWLVKTDESGNMEWNHTYGGSGVDYAFGLVETSDGGFALAGLTYSFGVGDSDFWLVKTDANGNVQWNQTYGGSGTDYAYDLVETSDGGYAIAGETRSFGAGEEDFWLIKTDGSGNMEWNQTYGGTRFEYGGALVELSDGGFALAGGSDSFGDGSYDFCLIKTDEFGALQWNKTYGGSGYDVDSSLVQTSDGGFALSGLTFSFGAGDADYWLIKTDSDGNMQWNHTYGGAGTDYNDGLVETADGGFALAGMQFSFGVGESNLWLVKTDASGNMQWNQTYAGAGFSYNGGGLLELSDGGFALAGETRSLGAGDADFWLIKTDENGVIPEFPSWTILPLLFTATLLVILCKKRLNKNMPKKS
ncbi:MAG: hypothetical protein CW691_05540 [Candidatus Bathyarchaeum sp.]|nr:MAG: hypothetical protein CW691_05540 [Candidatus Bathyarchaeum sp.]